MWVLWGNCGARGLQQINRSIQLWTMRHAFRLGIKRGSSVAALRGFVAGVGRVRFPFVKVAQRSKVEVGGTLSPTDSQCTSDDRN